MERQRERWQGTILTYHLGPVREKCGLSKERLNLKVIAMGERGCCDGENLLTIRSANVSGVRPYDFSFIDGSKQN